MFRFWFRIGCCLLVVNDVWVIFSKVFREFEFEGSWNGKIIINKIKFVLFVFWRDLKLGERSRLDGFRKMVVR